MPTSYKWRFIAIFAVTFFSAAGWARSMAAWLIPQARSSPRLASKSVIR